MTDPSTLLLLVATIDDLNPFIRRIVLRAPDGGLLPSFSAGAHIQVQVPLATGLSDWRHYSLISFDPSGSSTLAPCDYTIAVRREDAGRGGSKHMHRLKAGDSVTVQAPKNDFPLRDHEAPAVLVAGGIGVTPLASMATELKRLNRVARMVYAGRTRALMAFIPELRMLLADSLELHVDEEANAPLDIAQLLDGCDAGEILYVCGPKIMLDAILSATQARAWPSDRIRFELFSAPEAQTGDRAIEVVLKQSGKTLTVPADHSILDCLLDNGCDVLADCKRGECGICATNVLEGEVDHRDYVLTEAEKASGKIMQICVSRAKGPRLVLDL
ncbi:PDR/VanB family oxidoreductase [Variovorax sp. RT4R15]|uniref:PDR/VanB family oxidoreductase n=1 Tax=Variovorax sp. RT4R15 TaxID=3443737 RepID=UPI003F47A371